MKCQYTGYGCNKEVTIIDSSVVIMKRHEAKRQIVEHCRKQIRVLKFFRFGWLLVGIIAYPWLKLSSNFQMNIQHYAGE